LYIIRNASKNKNRVNNYANRRFKKGSKLFNAATRRPSYTSVVDDIVFEVNLPKEFNVKKKGQTALDHVNGIKKNMDLWNDEIPHTRHMSKSGTAITYF